MHTHLLDRNRLDEIDAGRMHDIYDSWPAIARRAYESEPESHGYTRDDIKHIIFAGMGGSGAVGDLFSAVLSKSNVHITVTKGYTLPATADKDTLIITTSVSGNTAETLAVLDSARRTDCRVLAFSSGGRMEEFCRRNRLRHMRIEQTHSPRASFVSFVFSMLKVLKDVLPLNQTDVTEATRRLDDLSTNISSANLTDSNVALGVAERLGEIPLIYYPFGLQAAAIRFKNCLQENAKTHAIVEDALEACHNGIVAWEKPSNVSPLIITGSDDHPKTRERWQILKEYFESRGIKYVEMSSGTGGILTKLVGLIYWADYASIYRAVIRGVDPSTIDSVRFIKDRI